MSNDMGKTRKYCIEMRRLFEKYYPEAINNIIHAERKQGLTPGDNMEGQNGTSSHCIVSKDLVNSPHYDIDISFRISIFKESKPGTAEDWYFVLPNTMTNYNKNKGIAIKLFHGCAICWDNRDIYHCTGLRVRGEDNRIYWNFFGAKHYS